MFSDASIVEEDANRRRNLLSSTGLGKHVCLIASSRERQFFFKYQHLSLKCENFSLDARNLTPPG